jgi:hypothetical protein
VISSLKKSFTPSRMPWRMPQRAGAIGAGTILHPADDLALHEHDHEGDDLQQAAEDEERS